MDPFCTKSTCSIERAAEITERITNFIIKDMRPICTVKGEGFTDMMKFLEPGYCLPSPSTFMKAIEIKYSDAMNKLCVKFLSCDQVCLTEDVWTSSAMEAYLGVTAHLINAEWDMQTYIVVVKPLEGSHTAENIVQWNIDVLHDFSIAESKVYAIVHDNGSNMVAAVRDLREVLPNVTSVRCAGHTLQLCLIGPLEDNVIHRTIAAARTLVKHFRKSTKALDGLKSKQKMMSLPEHTLIQDVATRWNSTYDMISRLLEQRWAVTAVLGDDAITARDKRYLDLTSDQWEILQKLEEVLEPFKTATKFLSAEQYVSLSVVIPLIKGLIHSLRPNEDDIPVIKRFKRNATTQLQDRWDLSSLMNEPVRTMCIATAIDPRFRRLKTFSSGEILFIQDLVSKAALELSSDLEGLPVTRSAESPRSKPCSSLDKLLEISTESDDTSSEDLSLEHIIHNENQKYFRETPVDKKTKPLQWWNNNKEHFPFLAKVARKYLCIPATSTPAERLFSAAGNISDRKRSSLLPEHVNMLSFLHANKF